MKFSTAFASAMTVTAGADDWFYDLPKAKQHAYIADHPKSKFAKSYAKGTDGKDQAAYHKGKKDHHTTQSNNYYARAEDAYKKSGGDMKKLKGASDDEWYSHVSRHLKKNKVTQGIDHLDKADDHYFHAEKHGNKHKKLVNTETTNAVGAHKPGVNWAAHSKITDPEHHRKQEKHHRIAAQHLREKAAVAKGGKKKVLEGQLEIRESWADKHSKKLKELGGKHKQEDLDSPAFNKGVSKIKEEPVEPKASTPAKKKPSKSTKRSSAAKRSDDEEDDRTQDEIDEDEEREQEGEDSHRRKKPKKASELKKKKDFDPKAFRTELKRQQEEAQHIHTQVMKDYKPLPVPKKANKLERHQHEVDDLQHEKTHLRLKLKHHTTDLEKQIIEEMIEEVNMNLTSAKEELLFQKRMQRADGPAR